MRWRLIVAAALATTLVGVGGERSGAAPSTASGPRTLVSLSEPIAAFAQDGRRIAWSTAGASECDKPTVHVLSLSTHRRTALPSKPGPKTCDGGDLYPGATLALAGGRALWPIWTQSNQETDGYFVTASVSDHSERRACKFGLLGGSEDDYTPTLATAGDGQTLAFTMFGEAIDGGSVCSGLWLVDAQGRARRIAARASALLAVGGRRIASAQTTDFGGCICNSGPTWSPNGTRIAFTSGRSGGREIYVVNADGSGEHRISQGESPDWSPDGTKIVFGRPDEQGASVLVVTNADGTGESVLGAGSGPGWSPDGSRIASDALDADGASGIQITNADGTAAKVIRGGYDWAWSPDGGRLAYISDGDLHVIGADGTGDRLVTSGAARPVWSPDGAKIVFAHELASAIVLGVVGADGIGLTQVTHPANRALDFADSWSPDGSTIVFERGGYDANTGGVIDSRLWLVSADGSNPHRLTSGKAAETDAAWEKSGGRIAFARGELYAIHADGSAEKRLTTTQPREARNSAELRSAPSGRLVATAAAAGRVQAIALSQSTAALLVAGFFGRRIELFDASSSASRGSVTVSAATAPELSASGAYVVFRVGNTIYLLDGQRRSKRILAVAASTPVGLSIEGRRVAWAENIRARGRIRAIVLSSP